MTFTVSGPSGWLHFIALICFLVATIAAWVAPGHRLVLCLIAAGAFFFTLATLWT